MKKQVFFIHGGDAFSKREDFLRYLDTVTLRNLPGSNSVDFWTKTLVEDLGEEYEVFMPSMPNKQNAAYDEWSIWFEKYFAYLKDDVILIGWSLGGMFLAKYLSDKPFPVKIKSLFLLAAPCGTQTDPEGNDCGSFQFDPNILRSLAERVEPINIWHSKDDFVVPYEQALEYQEHINKSKLVTFNDKNHFLLPKFPELLTAIKDLG